MCLHFSPDSSHLHITIFPTRIVRTKEWDRLKFNNKTQPPGSCTLLFKCALSTPGCCIMETCQKLLVACVPKFNGTHSYYITLDELLQELAGQEWRSSWALTPGANWTCKKELMISWVETFGSSHNHQWRTSFLSGISGWPWLSSRKSMRSCDANGYSEAVASTSIGSSLSKLLIIPVIRLLWSCCCVWWPCGKLLKIESLVIVVSCCCCCCLWVFGWSSRLRRGLGFWKKKKKIMTLFRNWCNGKINCRTYLCCQVIWKMNEVSS